MNRNEVIIITIGDELLIGQVVDTNSAWIGQQLAKQGVEIRRIISIADNKEAIANAVRLSMNEVSLVIVTGGLGPTKDDITKATLCEVFGAKLTFNQDVYDNVERLLLKRIGSINAFNKSQAFVPDKAEIFQNELGTAPIMKFKTQNSVLFSLPGVPYEMKHGIESVVIPYIQASFESVGFVNRTLLAVNIPESVLAELLEEWETALPEHVKLAYLPSLGLIRLRITIRQVVGWEGFGDMDNYCSQLKELLGAFYLNEGDGELEVLLGQILTRKKLSIATAESCTGGLIAHKITTVPGCSAYYKGGIVAYSNEVKTNRLNVKLTDVEKYGAVSQQVVEQMAQGAREAFACDVGVATSGIAGPDGGTEDKPVGTVWLAWAWGDRVESECFLFGKVRSVNVERAVKASLIGLIQRLG